MARKQFLVSLMAGCCLLVASVPTTAFAGPVSCASLTAPVYQRVNPRTLSSFLTTSRTEAVASGASGFTEDRGQVFAASLVSRPGLRPVHQLHRKSDGDRLYTMSGGEIAAALGSYSDLGVAFYAAPKRSACDSVVQRFRSRPGNKHRLVTRPADASTLTKTGWVSEGHAFEAGRITTQTPTTPERDADGRFSFAVMPDTQQEVLQPRDTRFRARTEWLTRNSDDLDLRFVTHSGDVVGWDTPDHRQYEVASEALKPLESAGIPYSLAIGNHDTAAVCTGGGACDPRRTRALFRDTTTFNRYFPASRFGAVAGAYESGKVDNSFSTFPALGMRWMVLNVEMWPRPGAVAWANEVVAAHPEHNVVVVTHHYLTADGEIGGTDAGYGDTSPQYLFDNLIKRHPNITMVFSGHVGAVANRVDTGVHGNRIHSFLEAIHSNTTNPVRLVTLDARARSLRSWVYAPSTNTVHPGSEVTLTDLSLVGQPR